MSDDGERAAAWLSYALAALLRDPESVGARPVSCVSRMPLCIHVLPHRATPSHTMSQPAAINEMGSGALHLEV
jgi:hypothetical protein